MRRRSGTYVVFTHSITLQVGRLALVCQDAIVEDIKNIPATQPHRNVDLEYAYIPSYQSILLLTSCVEGFSLRVNEARLRPI